MTIDRTQKFGFYQIHAWNDMEAVSWDISGNRTKKVQINVFKKDIGRNIKEVGYSDWIFLRSYLIMFLAL